MVKIDLFSEYYLDFDPLSVIGFQDLGQGGAYSIDLSLIHYARKRQRQAAASQVFGDRKIPWLVAKTIDHVGLQVDRSKIRPGWYPAVVQLFGDLVAMDPWFEAYHENEPAHTCGGGRYGGRLNVGEMSQSVFIPDFQI